MQRQIVAPIRVVWIDSAAPDCGAIATALARAGLTVSVIEQDPADHQRLQDLLTRQGGAQIRLCTPEALGTSADLVLSDGLYPGCIRGGILHAATRPLPGNTLPQLCFSGPAHLRSLVEILPGDAPQPHLDALMALVQTMGKTPLLTHDSLVIPLLDTMLTQLDTVLLQGALHVELDEAMTNAGADLGLCAAQDLIGLDRAYARRRHASLPRLLAQDRMIEEGRLGAQASVGWYRYPGGGGAVEDPLIEDLIAEEAHFASIPRRDISGEDALDRLIAALAQACAQLALSGVPVANLRCALQDGLGLGTALTSQALAQMS